MEESGEESGYPFCAIAMEGCGALKCSHMREESDAASQHALTPAAHHKGKRLYKCFMI